MPNQEKSLFKRNVEYHIQNLPNQSGLATNSNSKIEIGMDMKVTELLVPGLSPEQVNNIKNLINKALFDVFDQLSFYNPDDLDLRLSDYIDYVTKKDNSHSS